MTKQVAKRGSTGVALPFDYGEHAGKGVHLTTDDLKVPFLALLQSNSPECSKSNKKYINDAEAGKILNRATGELYDSLNLNIAAMETRYVEYASPRVVGVSGFIDTHLPGSQTVVDALSANGNSNFGLKTKTGTDLVQTKSIYAIVLDPDGEPLEFVVVGFASTKLGPWREYWNAVNTAKVIKDAPVYAHLVTLSSFDDKNAKGEFANYILMPMNLDVRKSLAAPDSASFRAALKLFQGVQGGTASADYAAEDGGAPVNSGDSTF